ncbi:MAG TPA: dihydropteroate synthase [Bryobacteraceae bacterium]|nr:dihydropteroate synthase [Bryobacteraceae bacterium]
MTRTRTDWKVRDHVLTIGERTLIMGVLNVTPDSFSDGGKYLDPDAAVARAMQLEQEGADIIDIGAESTKPGSERINAGEELRRLVPVLKRLKGSLSIPICVDTYKAEVAEKALEHGASIINDVSALTWEPDLVKPVIQYDAGLVLNHMRGTPETWARLGPMKDVMGSLIAELEAAVHRAVRSGVPKERIVIDPGIGFGKRGEQNSEILARLGELQRLGTTILVAASRKSFLAQEDPKALEFATAGAVTVAILNGAAIVRVHDVAAMKPVVQTVDAIVEATPEREEKPKPAIKPRLDSDVQAERRKQPVRPVRLVKVEPPVAPELPEVPPMPIEAPKKVELNRPILRPRQESPADDRPRRPFERRSDGPPADRRPDRTAYQGRKDDRKGGDEKRDRPFRRGPDDRGDRPTEKRPFQRAGSPSRPTDRRADKPSDKRDRPFRPREDQGPSRTARPPYKRADNAPAGRPPAGGRPTGRPPAGGKPSGPRSPGARPPGARPPAGRPFERGDRPFPPRDDRRSGPSGPRRDDRGDRPSGGGSRGGSGGKGPYGPKRGGSGPPKRGGGPPRKRS